MCEPTAEAVPGRRGLMQKDNTLRRLNRAQLLDLLYDAVKEKEDLERELEETRRQLSEKNIQIAESGSIAEAALKLNRVFEQAQAAADQYLFSIRSENRPKAAPKESRENVSEEDPKEGPKETPGEISEAGAEGATKEAAEEASEKATKEAVEEVSKENGTDDGWTAARFSGEEKKADRKKLVKRLMQGAKVTQSADNPNIFCTDRGDVVFLKTAGDGTSVLYRIIPLNQVLDCYYKKVLCPDRPV